MKVQWKQQWIYKVLGVFITVIFLSCTGFFELEEEGIIDLGGTDQSSTTKIYFSNANNCVVEIFSTPIRGDINKIATVNARANSSERSWIHTNEGYQFYLTYNFQIQGKLVPYIPQRYYLDYVMAAIPKNVTTPITIPLLSSGSIPSDVALFDETYLVIKNNFASAIQLMNNNSILYPVGEGTTLVNSGNTALYKINKGANISVYNVLVQGVRKSLNEKILAFESSFLYEVSVSSAGIIELNNSKLLTLNSLLP